MFHSIFSIAVKASDGGKKIKKNFCHSIDFFKMWRDLYRIQPDLRFVWCVPGYNFDIFVVITNSTWVYLNTVSPGICRQIKGLGFFLHVTCLLAYSAFQG
jgi:hypothetical protein